MIRGINFDIISEFWNVVYDIVNHPEDRQHLADSLVSCLLDNGIDINDIEAYLNESPELIKSIKMNKDEDIEYVQEDDYNDFDDDDMN